MMKGMSDLGPPSEPEWIGEQATTSAAAASRSRLATEATRLQTRALLGASMLRLAAVAAGLVWIVTAVSAFATEWHSLDQGGGGFGIGPNSPSSLWRLLTSITLSGQASWGYAIAAVIAFSASVWMSREQARDALDALDDD
jgi:hypothetical protein